MSNRNEIKLVFETGRWEIFEGFPDALINAGMIDPTSIDELDGYRRIPFVQGADGRFHRIARKHGSPGGNYVTDESAAFNRFLCRLGI